MSLPPARSLIVVALVLAGFVNVYGMVLSAGAHARFRDSTFAAARARAAAVRSALEQRLASGALRDRDAVLRQALAEGDAEIVEAFTPDGRRVAAFPEPGPPSRWLSQAEMASLSSGAVLAGHEDQGQRVATYAMVPLPDGATVLRLLTASPELAEDGRVWRQMFLGHAATLLVLLLVGGLVLGPRRAEAEAAPPRALVAYEEAMERLRDHGEEQTVRHAAERRQMEEILRDKEALARAGELTAGIVHEVRNGLGTIVGYARLIENTVPAGTESAKSIRDECETLETVIRRFVDFVKRETLSLAPVDVARMLKRVSEREGRRPGATVLVDASAAGSIVADDELLERALENVVRNAREAAGPGGRVWVTAARDATAASITVSDDGPGLSAAARAALRPFFTTKPGGLGLGLAITLKIVRLHDGQLTLGERPPHGAAVTIRLPADGPATAPAAAGT